jgi:hypothetical protein
MCEYSIDFHAGEYICKKCGKRIKIAPHNTQKKGYYGNRGRYNYRGGKGALVRHLRACYRKKANLPEE